METRRNGDGNPGFFSPQFEGAAGSDPKETTARESPAADDLICVSPSRDCAEASSRNVCSHPRRKYKMHVRKGEE